MLSGTEADIINSVARLKQATKGQIRKKVGFSLEYIGYVCRDLIRKGYLNFSKGYYSLDSDGIKALLIEETPKIDKKLLKEVAEEVAKEIGGQLKESIKDIKVFSRDTSRGVEPTPERQVKIKTDFEFDVEDESLNLESNIDRIGINLEKEKSDIESKVELLKGIQRRGKR